MALDVSLDGRTLLNVGWNNRLTLYDLTRDIVLGEPIDTGGADVRGGYLTADGETLVTALTDGILLWDLVPEHQALAACEMVGRELSAAGVVDLLPRRAAGRDLRELWRGDGRRRARPPCKGPGSVGLFKPHSADRRESQTSQEAAEFTASGE